MRLRLLSLAAACTAFCAVSACSTVTASFGAPATSNDALTAPPSLALGPSAASGDAAPVRASGGGALIRASGDGAPIRTSGDGAPTRK